MRRLIALVALVSLTACGDTKSPEVDRDDSDANWYTVTDPETDTTLRCFDRWRKSGYAGGLATWCIEHPLK